MISGFFKEFSGTHCLQQWWGSNHHTMTIFQQQWLVPVLKLLPPPLSLLILYIAASSIINSQYSILPVNETVGNVSVYDWTPSTPSLASISYGRTDFDTHSQLQKSQGIFYSAPVVPRLVSLITEELERFSNFQNTKQESITSCSGLNSRFAINSVWQGCLYHTGWAL